VKVDQLRHDASERASSARERVPEPLRRLVGWVTGPEFFITSSSLAFYALISIPPMTIIALWVAGGFFDDSVRHDVEDRSPNELPVGEIVRGLVDTATRIGGFSVVAAVWPATAYGAALAKAFSMIAPESERSLTGWKGRLLSLGVLALLPLVVFAALAALYFGPLLVDADGAGFTVLLALGALVVYGLVVLAIFELFQVRDTSFGDIAVGAAVAAVGQALLTAGYLVYVGVFADFEETYGSSLLATVILLGFWLLLSNACLLASYRLMLKRCRRRLDGDGGDDGGDAGSGGSSVGAASGDEPEGSGTGRRPQTADGLRDRS